MNSKNAYYEIRAMRPKSIFDVMPEDVFIERDDREHPYIRGGNTYEWKYSIAQWLQPRSIAEIGVRYGYSLASLIAGSGALQAYGYDNGCYRSDWMEKARAAVGLVDAQVNLQLFDTDCNDLKQLPTVDLVHIDGPHTYEGTLHCLNLCIGKAKAVLVDDYFSCPVDAEAVHKFRSLDPTNSVDQIVLLSDRGDCLLLLHK